MNLVQISGHSFDLDALPERPRVLDVGSFHNEFTKGILTLRPGAEIVCIEPNPKAPEPPQGVRLIRAALVGDYRRCAWYRAFSTGEGNYIPDDDDRSISPSACCSVACRNIRELTSKSWDLVKLDCEGSEFSILENWPLRWRFATQISVEFHDYKKIETYNPDYFVWLFHKLQKYEVVKHDFFKHGEAWGHWDSLLRWRE